MTRLSLDHLSVTLRGRTILRDISLDLGAGEFVGLIGPNGAGKTTLMRASLGLVPFDGQSSLAALPATDRARAAAWMPQTREIAWPVSVETVIALGRVPYLGAGQRLSETDRAAVEGAIARMGLETLRGRTATRLSGGEQARVLIARALAQETPLILADEPVAGLDPAHQIATMQLFADLARQGRSLLVSLHDLGLAVRHCTRLVLLSGGRIAAEGRPADVLTPETLRTHFGITAHFAQTPDGPVFQPLAVVP
ncbi:ABC transporter ATP-binding protein [Celeribacter indicus]|uniref:ABC transporter n=1 Tax=Celeribacter indicus TaxID=1208324 RepID=A0A0B5DXS7_9RHOB|nr:ABC transporter ATP-binding protein [Celeribacter indicus]AJE47804.1 ABC transporter [Celeribacter indicus]SDW23463.1 iron complex transport system ATP-binding protein [Celeribacter indicus]